MSLASVASRQSVVSHPVARRSASVAPALLVTRRQRCRDAADQHSAGVRVSRRLGCKGQ